MYDAKLQEIVDRIAAATPVLPVVVIEDASSAVPLAETLLAAGFAAIEITLRTPAALQAIQSIANKVPEMLLSAGTVLNAKDLQSAGDAGATFAISPGATPALLNAAREQGMPLIPGVATASEVMQALELGYEFYKLFPASIAGGVDAIKALGGPFPTAKFCPTGGVSMSNAAEYLRQPNVVCVGGSWLTPSAALRSKDWVAIAKLARYATEQLRPVRA
jgi:2-dehydro-3-deoxyphosphogluconate aldolase/(4S)-4-hydroxy-2-oxoglutarate aldolase